jgi:hypothetical protein
MLATLKSRAKQLVRQLERASSLLENTLTHPESDNEVIAALEEFLRQESDYSSRDKLFAAIVRRFAAHNPIPSQVKAMFDALLVNIVSRMHYSVFWSDRLLTLGKAASFLEEEAFSSSYEAIRGSHLCDFYDTRHTISWRLHTLVWAARSAIAHEGDLVECGVFKGDMSWVIASIRGDKITDRNFYLYDSFEGFSPTLSSAADFPDNPGFLKMANKIYSDPAIYEMVSKNLRTNRT